VGESKGGYNQPLHPYGLFPSKIQCFRAWNEVYWNRFLDSTYATPFLNCNTSSAFYGMKSFKKRRMKEIAALPPKFSLGFAIFFPLYTRAVIRR
jgi:hypothetical protein